MPSLHQLHGPAPTTREAWSEALIAVVAPATRTAALGPDWLPVHATSRDRGATWFELVTRPLWGLAAQAAGGLGGAKQQWHEVRTALTAALDPRHSWYIGAPIDADQRLVESAALGYGLTVAPQELWEPLTGRQRGHLIDWLQAAAAAGPCDNNWCFFPVLAAMGLRSVGAAVDERQVAAHLDRIDEFALADGWYADGPGSPGRPAARDYYVPFGFHFYSLLLADLGGVGEERAQRYRQRARQFAGQFQEWFAADGAAVPFGRSLGYRFAQGAFWSVLAAADLPAAGWPVVRGLAQRHLDWWWKHPVAAEDGGLTVGYAYPNSGVAEQYIAAGSPYWATKFFAALAAPADHPFWTSVSEPVSPRESISVQPVPGMVLARDLHGDVVALAGQQAPQWNPRGAAAKYAKFAYSTLAAFSVPTGADDLEHSAFDSTLALSDDGEHWRSRSAGHSWIDGDSVLVRWQPWPDVTIETRLTPLGSGRHQREHRIITARALHTAEGGFCVPWLSQQPQPPGTDTKPGLARAGAGGVLSEIVCAGPRQRLGEIQQPMAGSHLLHPRTILPALRCVLEPGEHLLTCTVSITRG